MVETWLQQPFTFNKTKISVYCNLIKLYKKYSDAIVKRFNVFLLHVLRNVRNAAYQGLKHSFSLKTTKEYLKAN